MLNRRRHQIDPGRSTAAREAMPVTLVAGLVILGAPILLQSPALGTRSSALPHQPQSLPTVAEAPSFSPPLGHAADYLPQVRGIEESYLLLKLSERRLYLYTGETVVNTYPVAVGRQGWETPTGQFTVLHMQQDPIWQHPFTGELVPPGDSNPLGRRWIGFWSDGTNAIGFHGTPDESSIGQAISHGCVRLHNQDVIALYDQVAIGTPVYVMP